MDDVMIHRLDVLLKNINQIISDTQGKTLEEFASSDLLVRATCFSFEQVGEQMRILEKKFSREYPEIPWDKAIGLRVKIAHVYHKIEAEAVYITAINDIPVLKEQILNLKSDLITKDNN